MLGFEDIQYNADEILLYNCIYPHEFIPDVTTETKRFINFEISENNNYMNDTFRNVTVYFYILCHQNVIKYEDDGRQYLWYDKVVCELDELFSDINEFGVGKMEIISNVPYYSSFEWKGRLVTFKAKDFTNNKKYGK